MPKKRFPYYPIFLDIEQRDVLIVGGGEVCARKAATLLRYGASVTVVSPEAGGEIGLLAGEGKIRMLVKSYDESDLDGRTLVIASTDDPCVNARVARDCRRRRIPVNVVDVTHLCEFIVPAVAEQGSIQVAVSTGGKSPALARQVRLAIEKAIGPEWSEVNDLLGRLRPAAKKALATDRERKEFFDSIVAADVVALIRDGRRDQAWERITAICRSAGVPFAHAVPPPGQE